MGTLLTITASVSILLLGLVYLIKPRFMGYHKTAIQKDWNELVPEMQTLILALMRAVSGGWISVAIACIILQLQFNRSQQHWIALTILIMGGVAALGGLYAVLMVRTRTKGRPPILIPLLSFVMLLIGYFFNTLGS